MKLLVGWEDRKTPKTKTMINWRKNLTRPKRSFPPTKASKTPSNSLITTRWTMLHSVSNSEWQNNRKSKSWREIRLSCRVSWLEPATAWVSYSTWHSKSAVPSCWTSCSRRLDLFRKIDSLLYIVNSMTDVTSTDFCRQCGEMLDLQSFSYEIACQKCKATYAFEEFVGKPIKTKIVITEGK